MSDNKLPTNVDKKGHKMTKKRKGNRKKFMKGSSYLKRLFSKVG